MVEEFTNFMALNPEYGYLLGAAAFLFIIIGLILDWDWVLEPGGGYFNIAYYIDVFGRKRVRIVFGFISFLAVLLFIYGFFTYNPELYNV
ncbi:MULTISPECIES: immunity 17 family protein [Winogradskyella]|uniref:immunity 17 family protein n=1 Tax=Winogradskyella TaxID=286104 RepID=UPI0015CED03D|nr:MULTISPECIES: immunity 17 family protein [Winogradskyella]QXP78447.1 immunity 17 family protein [Winogradskyella sp. HaHa_3_26]